MRAYLKAARECFAQKRVSWTNLSRCHTNVVATQISKNHEAQKLWTESMYFALIVAATLAFTVSNGATAAKNPTAANVATPPPPTVAALMTLEKSAYQAWKSKDARFWDTFLWDNFVGYGSSGKLDKASAKRDTPALIARSRVTFSLKSS